MTERVAIGTRLLDERDVAAPGRGWQQGDPVVPGRDGTLLAVVPLPGTGTSLAVVGYVVSAGPATEAAPPRDPAPGQADRAAGGLSVTPRGLRIDDAQRRVWVDGAEVPLTFQQFELLAFLVTHPARVFSRAELAEQVWRRDFGRDSRTVDVHVSRLRAKLGPVYGRFLVTEYRAGYQYRPPLP